MQQLYLCGEHAQDLANRLFTSLNIRPAGYRLEPFSVGGGMRGEALHLLVPPSVPMDNDVPCRIRLRSGDWAVVPRVLDEIAAPNLARLTGLHAPILLGGLTAEMLTCAAFREAVGALLAGPRPGIAACADDAEEILRALTPEADQLWEAVPQTEEGRCALLEELVSEASLRM